MSPVLKCRLIIYCGNVTRNRIRTGTMILYFEAFIAGLLQSATVHIFHKQTTHLIQINNHENVHCRQQPITKTYSNIERINNIYVSYIFVNSEAHSDIKLHSFLHV